MVAATDATVLVQGETGTGKELVARALHEASRRAGQTFTAVNCAALPAALIESELFGHERGAFTGAHADRIGRFESAHGGTLFLDEVGELSPEAQSKLLRVIQERQVERVGSNRTRHVDVRIVAATHRDLAREAAQGRFRSDLYYRLNVFPIHVPPLLRRRSDIPLLASHFLREAAERLGKRLHGFTDSAIAALSAHDWPGNVRELANVVERAAILARGTRVGVEECALGVYEREVEEPLLGISTLKEAERTHILRALERTGWTVEGPAGAAQILGINASTLRSRMRKHGIQRP